MLRSTVRRRGEALPAPPNSSHWQPEMFVQWSPLRCDSPPNPLPPFVFCSSHILTPSNRLRCICRNIPLRLCCNLARTPVLTRSPLSTCLQHLNPLDCTPVQLKKSTPVICTAALCNQNCRDIRLALARATIATETRIRRAPEPKSN